jgi:hypothetical protein
MILQGPESPDLLRVRFDIMQPIRNQFRRVIRAFKRVSLRK